MKIALGADHGGFGLKEEIKRHLEEKGDYELEDLGTFDEASVDYPDYGAAVARQVASGQAERGILVCGTGIGISYRSQQDQRDSGSPLRRRVFCQDEPAA